VLIGIVAHHTRADVARKLVETVDADVCRVDENGPGNVQDGVEGCSVNHINVLTALGAQVRGDEWCVLLEDDALPVPQFRSHATQALEYAPSPLVGFYLGQGIPSGDGQGAIRQAIDCAQAWIRADCFLTSVGYAIRSDLIDDLVSDVAVRNSEFPMRVNRWSHQRGIMTAYTNPSLVDHADTDSVICYNASAELGTVPRVAWRYGTRTDWDTPVVALGHVPNWSPA
jgi:hypothetical protein